jgi:hypothetical protein
MSLSLVAMMSHAAWTAAREYSVTASLAEGAEKGVTTQRKKSEIDTLALVLRKWEKEKGEGKDGVLPLLVPLGSSGS